MQKQQPCEDDFETIKLISNGAYGWVGHSASAVWQLASAWQCSVHCIHCNNLAVRIASEIYFSYNCYYYWWLNAVVSAVLWPVYWMTEGHLACRTPATCVQLLLWPPYVIGGPLYFCPVVSFFFFLLSSFFSSPNLSGHRLEVYHTLAHGVALVRI